MSLRAPGRYEKDLTKYQTAIEQLAQGRVNCTGTFTLAANATSTTVDAPTVAPGTIIVPFQQTAHAAAEIAAGTMYISPSNVTAGSFIVTHANNAQVDRTFGFVAFG